MQNLERQWETLLHILKRLALVDHMKGDQIFWLDSQQLNYSVKERYDQLVKTWPHPTPSSLWHKIWNKDGLPTVNTCWTLMQEKNLDVENLKKRNIQGASWCVLCKTVEEDIHVFFINLCLP